MIYLKANIWVQQNNTYVSLKKKKKVKAIPACYRYLLKKVKLKKAFLPNVRLLLFILDCRNKFFLKNLKIFSQTLPLNVYFNFSWRIHKNHFYPVFYKAWNDNIHDLYFLLCYCDSSIMSPASLVFNKKVWKPVMKSSELLMKTRYNQKYYTIPDFQWINTSSLPTVIPNNLPAQSSNTPSQVWKPNLCHSSFCSYCLK